MGFGSQKTFWIGKPFSLKQEKRGFPGKGQQENPFDRETLLSEYRERRFPGIGQDMVVFRFALYRESGA